MNPLAEEWYPQGPGRCFQFYAVEEELVTILREKLPTRFAPYELIQYSRRRGKTGEYENHFTSVPFPEAVDSVVKSSKTSYLRSLDLTPELVMRDGLDIRELTFRGLISVDPGDVLNRGLEPSAIGMLHRVVHLESGEVYEHKEYDKIYQSMVRSLKKLLAVNTTMTLLDGEVLAERMPRMTRAMADRVRQGIVKTVHQPIE